MYLNAVKFVPNSSKNWSDSNVNSGWVEVPGVDQSRIEALRQQLKSAGSILISAPRIGQTLREDRLIGLVRQRLSILAGAAVSIFRLCISGYTWHSRIVTRRLKPGLPA